MPLGNMQYVTCNKVLDRETNEHCEFDGIVLVTGTSWRCPACRSPRFGPSNP